MIRIFETGDIHIGKKYDDYPAVKEKLIDTRFQVLQKMIQRAEEDNCDFFVVTGDLFDNVRNIPQKDVERIVNILSVFSERVLVLPGNHDYYTEDVKVWNDFAKSAAKAENNITLLTRFEPYEFDVREEKVVFYPAYCQDKHSKENNLSWIKNSAIDQSCINIGVAHGAIEGITPDKNQEYFLMSQNELNAVPVDVWLIGHTHIPFPQVMTDLEEHTGYKIFNAGTHAQTDVHNNTAGYGFEIDVHHDGAVKTIKAKAVKCGEIRFYDIDINLTPEKDDMLELSVKESVDDLQDNSFVRLNLSGAVRKDEYDTRNAVYDKYLNRFLFYKIEDSELSEEITIEKIRDEFAETSFAAKFMEALSEDPKEMAMAYELLKECKE